MIEKDPFKGLAGIYKFTSDFADILKPFNEQSYRQLLYGLNVASDRTKLVNDIVGKQMMVFKDLDAPIRNYQLLNDSLTKQWDIISKSMQMFQTPAIIKLQNSLLQNDFSALQTFADSLSFARIEAPNLALLRLTELPDMMKLPKGIASVVRGINVYTAERLSRSSDVGFDMSSKMFYVELEPEEKATIEETNILCSALQLLSDLKESELIVFQNHLEKYPNFGSENSTGKKIKEIIANWDCTMNFDREIYYHARPLENDKSSYTFEELRRAPKGYAGQGRYNFTGQSHYYFSDAPKGARLEVTKHSKDAERIQIARLKPNKDIKMIDLSQEITTPNKFLEHCRLKANLDPMIKIKKEYLLPCYVASCCEIVGIEGIKYYGSKEYKNYVSWEDTYFDILDSEIIHV